MKLIVLVGWRDTEIERVLMGVSQQNCQWTTELEQAQLMVVDKGSIPLPWMQLELLR